MERKGHLVVEDMVRFLNMETGNFYRNRDLYLMVGRVRGGKGQEKLSFTDLMRTLC